jgi:hypothetical protein
MNSKPLVAPELVAVLDMLPPPRLSAELLPRIRAAPLQFPINSVANEAVDLLTRFIPGPAGAPEVRSAEHKAAPMNVENAGITRASSCSRISGIAIR